MSLMRFLASLLIKLLLDMPVMVLGLMVVPTMLLLKCDMSRTWWGNRDHPDNGGGFWRRNCGDSIWCAFKWFALRNPSFNFGKYVLGIKAGEYIHVGDDHVGDDKRGGSYWCYMGPWWEYMVIVPYEWNKDTNRCIKLRFGWKIKNKAAGEMCQFVFVFNPVGIYTGDMPKLPVRCNDG